MTTEDMITAVVLGGAVLYLVITSTRFPNGSPVSIPVTDADLVMRYAADMLRFGAEQGVDPALIASVMMVESSGRPDAVGAAGEVGLMQILSSTAEWIGGVSAERLQNPATNIQIGTAYIRYCVDRKSGNVAAGVAGYNYGPGRVSIQNNQVVAPESVLRYANNVLSLVEYYRAKFRSLGKTYTGRFGDRLILSGLRCQTC